jgi:hypothetical protein
MKLQDLGPVEYRWMHVTDEPGFRGRDGVGALVFNDRMFLLGGWNPIDPEYYPRHCVNDVWSSDDGTHWQMEKENTFRSPPFAEQGKDWEGTHTAGYVVYRDKMWIIGGDPLQGHYQPDVWNSRDGKSWDFVNRGRPVPWHPRCLHHTFVMHDKIWVLGGQTLPQFAPAPERLCHDLWCTEDGVEWTEVAMTQPYTPLRAMYSGSVIFQNRVWLLGGGTYETPELPHYGFYNDVWSSADVVNWEQHTDAAPWRPRVYVNVAVFDERMWVFGGQTAEGNSNDVWYSSDGATWHEVPDTPWAARHAASTFVYKGALWFMCGSHLKTDVWKLERV